MRFQRALSIGERAASLADLALAVGYADQAHMTRDIVALSGATPARIIGRTTTTVGLSDFFKNGASIESMVRV
jgi:AraC-like DNA-binding protein